MAVEDFIGHLCPECNEEMLTRFDALDGWTDYCSNCQSIYRYKPN
jgi:hypothetical protein